MGMRLTLPLALLMLAGCAATAYPEATMTRLNQQYAGRNVDQFFLRYGMPAGQYQMHSGGRIYRWVSPVDTYVVPSPPVFYGYYHPFWVDSYPPEVIQRYCEIQIQTDYRGRIRRLVRTADTAGRVSTSRCAEIFDNPPPQ